MKNLLFGRINHFFSSLQLWLKILIIFYVVSAMSTQIGAYFYAHSKVVAPTFLNVEMSDAEIAAEYKSAQTLISNENDSRKDIWKSFAKEYSNENRSVDFNYLKKGTENTFEGVVLTLKSVGEWFSGTAKSFDHERRKAYIFTVNTAKKEWYRANLYKHYLLFKGSAYLVLSLVLFFIIGALFEVYMDTLSFGWYKKMRNRLQKAIGSVPFMGGLTAFIIVFIIEIIVSSVVGFDALAYEFAQIPDLSSLMYSLFEWDITTPMWKPMSVYIVFLILSISLLYFLFRETKKLIS